MCNKMYYIVVSVYVLYFPILLHRVVIKDTKMIVYNKLGATYAEVNAFISKLYYRKVSIS